MEIIIDIIVEYVFGIFFGYTGAIIYKLIRLDKAPVRILVVKKSTLVQIYGFLFWVGLVIFLAWFFREG